MDITEIAVGNFITIYEILKQVDEKLMKELPQYDPTDIQPVVISEKWLLAFDFEKTVQSDMTRYYRLKEGDLLFEIVFPKRKPAALYIYKSNEMIKHYVREEHFMIHILQNVYEQHTGKKLEKNTTT
ncbi:hypothetical protein [Chryseobacterium sp. CFBP8996]|uniref:hypothetical protein n=1 Tax=Chryseobacterium sp. CFBP8996 TaxID=3096529 RepID=UPI002A6AAC74|nr:hypothetical protein [Chryseobacterium sp. CFBP8996]MDY0930737.1 hypothetical protein [Chryseobacterium sp. CFBP8996]